MRLITPQIFLFIFITNVLQSQEIQRQTDNNTFKELLKIYQPRSKDSLLTEQHYDDSKFFDFILTADIQPYFYIYNKESSNFSIAAVPRFKVRMINEFSKPVRTPSYIPGFVMDYKAKKAIDKNKYHGVRLSAFHHSNGLNDTINVNTPNDNELDETKYFNRFDGGFSTNYIEIGYNTITSALNESIKKKLDYYIGVRWHPRIPELTNDELFGRYPVLQLTTKFQKSYAKKWNDTKAAKIEKEKAKKNNSESIINTLATGSIQEYQRIEFGFDSNLSNMSKTSDFKFYNRFNVYMTYYYSPKLLGLNSASFYIEIGYKGQDDYNIYFEDNFFYTSLGIALGPKYYRKE